MSEDAVLYEVEDAIATVTLNRPENRNSMTKDVLEGLGSAVAKIREDSSIRCAIITNGAGRAWATRPTNSQPTSSARAQNDRVGSVLSNVSSNPETPKGNHANE